MLKIDAKVVRGSCRSSGNFFFLLNSGAAELVRTRNRSGIPTDRESGPDAERHFVPPDFPHALLSELCDKEQDWMLVSLHSLLFSLLT